MSYVLEPKRRAQSTAPMPTSLAEFICATMSGAKRGTVIAECVRQGVAYHTARTVYQKWFAGRKAKT